MVGACALSWIAGVGPADRAGPGNPAMIAAPMTYEEMCAAHCWDVPARYNIAAEVCDEHPREKPAMIWEASTARRAT